MLHHWSSIINLVGMEGGVQGGDRDDEEKVSGEGGDQGIPRHLDPKKRLC